MLMVSMDRKFFGAHEFKVAAIERRSLFRLIRGLKWVNRALLLLPVGLVGTAFGWRVAVHASTHCLLQGGCI